MTTTKIYGASDDLVEIEGDIREEFQAGSAGDGDPRWIAFSDGTVLRVAYTDGGIWRFTPAQYGSSEVDIEQAPEGDDDNYSDVVTLTGEIKWAAFVTELAIKR